MEDKRKRLGKSPAVPIPKPPLFTKMTPTTLSEAFEMPSNSNVMSSAQADKNIAISPETKIVDLNIPFPLVDVDKNLSPPVNGYPTTPQVPQSSPTETSRHLSTLDQVVEKELKNGCTIDPRKLRRTISNRLSAQRSRMKKAQHVVDLEQKIEELRDTIAILHPQIENYKNKQKALLIQNAAMEQQLHNCMTRSNLCSIEIEENKREMQRLKELQKMQREKMMLATNVGRQQRPNINMYGSHQSQQQPSSSFRHYCEESNYTINTDPTMVDQYINFDDLN